MGDRNERHGAPGADVKERPRSKTRQPERYNGVVLKDDYTPMQFVVEVLEHLFQRSPAEAHRIMMQVHMNGRGLAGVYPRDGAATKVDALLSLAREAGHPLQATIEGA